MPGQDEYLLEPISHTTSHDDDAAVYHDAGAVTHLASVAEKKRLWWRNAVINTLFIASWFFFATILSVYNKWMFTPKHFGFPSPLFVTALHMFVQFVLAAILRASRPAMFRPERNPTRTDYGTKALPTAVATALDIGLSNLSLKTITLSFYTMCKSSSLIFVLLFAFIFKLETPSVRLIGVILLIFSGVLLMVVTQTHFVLSGLILVLSASALGGLRWSLTQVLLNNKKMGMDNPAATIYWLSPIMGVTLALISAVVDNWMVLFRTPFFDGIRRTLTTAIYLGAPGVVAFCMVLSEFYIIQRAGVVPVSIAGIAKEVATIIVSSWFFGDQLTPLNITGVGITICGIVLFTYHNYRKSIESTVPLDSHGNPIPSNRFDRDASQFHAELSETEPLTSRSRDSSDMDENRRILFSAEGEEDAEEVRSIRSSQVPWTSDVGPKVNKSSSNVNRDGSH